MKETAVCQFKKEIKNFYLTSILNLVFAALAMAFGISIFVQKALLLTATPANTGIDIYSVFILFIAIISVLTGFFWLLKSIGIFEGLETLKDDFDKKEATISDEEITGLIVRMLSHYRENKDTISTMIFVCTIGGISFFLLGIANSIEYIRITPTGAEFSLNSYLIIPGMIFTLAIAFVSLYSSYYFSKFSKVWDIRLKEIEESGEILKKTLEHDRA